MPPLSKSGTPTLPFHFRSSLVLAARQFPRNRAATVGFVILLAICLAAAFAPWVAPFDPIQIKLSMKLKPPSLEHLMGTDHFGRDVLRARHLHATAARLAVDADAHLHFVRGDLERRLARGGHGA